MKTQDCKIGMVCAEAGEVLVRGEREERRVKEED
jgi:hypothetical protein